MEKLTRQQVNTKQWVMEYVILSRLESEIDPDDEEFGEGCGEYVGPVTSFDQDPQVGEVRLLALADKLTYGVILPWGDEDQFLLVPMSHMENPANDLEMLAEDGGKMGLFQQVYQIWNSRSIPRDLAAKSWVVWEVSEDEIKRLNKMMRFHLLGESLPDEIKNLTGMPIYKTEDPRHEYMKKAAENLVAYN